MSSDPFPIQTDFATAAAATAALLGHLRLEHDKGEAVRLLREHAKEQLDVGRDRRTAQ